MCDRQERYAESNVRGLWLVKTSKPFPVSHGKWVPIFRVSWKDQERRVHVGTHLDWPEVWRDRAEHLPLDRFIGAALGKRLRWAPLAQTWRELCCDVDVRLSATGRCGRCGTVLGIPYTTTARFAASHGYPAFVWHRGMTDRRSSWLTALHERVVLAQSETPKLMLGDYRTKSCPWCASPDQIVRTNLPAYPLLRAQISLTDLPVPRPGTIEWDWIQRWVIV